MGDASTPLSAEGVGVLATFVIRPPRAVYHRRDLGHRRFHTSTPRAVPVTRTDLQLVNARGQTLQCSHYIPAPPGWRDGTPAPPMPAVVYLHGNGSCRVEAEILFDHTLPHGMSVFAFDFSGSGKSDGEYISLGVFEKFDVETVVTYLASCAHVTSIALWGHSMGAATATMYTGFVDPSANGPPAAPPPGPTERTSRLRRPSLPRPRSRHAGVCGDGPPVAAPAADCPLRGMVDAAPRLSQITLPPLSSARPAARVKALILDSAFASFEKLALAMVATMPLPAAIPQRLILSVGVRAVRKAVRDKAGFDVYDIDPLSACKRINPAMPAILLQGTRDEIVHLAHAHLLLEAYPGRDVELVVMDGIDHDSPRPGYAIERAFILLQRTLFDDEGPMSVRYLDAIKMRGNDCMVDARYKDAVFLYTNALEAVVDQERAERCRVGAASASSATTTPEMEEEHALCAVPPATAPAAAAGIDEASRESHLWPDSDDNDSGLPVGSSRTDTSAKRSTVAKRILRFGDALYGVTRKLARRENSDPQVGRTPPAPADRRAFAASRSQSSGTFRTAGADDGGETSGGIDGGGGGGGRLRRPRISFSQRGSVRSPPPAGTGVLSRFSGVGRSAASAAQARASADPTGRTEDGAPCLEDAIRWHELGGERKNIALALLGNRSLARLKMKEKESALMDAELAIELDPAWLRGYQRKAAALKALDRMDDARLCVVDGLRLAPTSAALLAMEAEFEEEALAAALAASIADQGKPPTSVSDIDGASTDSDAAPPAAEAEKGGRVHEEATSGDARVEDMGGTSPRPAVNASREAEEGGPVKADLSAVGASRVTAAL
jgi:alpha-beta hydrolase superfamily lysophospholipase/tetratricopeptide (TPR) repeat protein